MGIDFVFRMCLGPKHGNKVAAGGGNNDSAISSSRKIAYATTSFVLGAWAFYKVNSISGPAFEPIVEACTNPDYTSVEEFVSKSGYHAYEPMVGLKVFNFMVCLITQFLLELRQTYPAGMLTWLGVVLVGMPAGTLMTIEAGRAGGARGPIRYPIILGLLYQLFGISVMFPLLWVPSYVYGRGSGPISNYRVAATIPLNIPGILLTVAVFSLDTDSYLWTLCAGILGGPLIAMSPAVLWNDVPPPSTNTEIVQKSVTSVQHVFRFMTLVGVIGWYISLSIVYNSYSKMEGPASSIAGNLWSDVWVKANASVAFMTIDTGVLYVGVLLCIAFQDATKALRTIMLTPVMGPAAASWVLAELEETRYEESSSLEKTKIKET